MIHLNNSGSAYEIGLQHGSSCPEAVRLAYEAWGRTEGIEVGQIEAGVQYVVERLQKRFPETVDEMRDAVSRRMGRRSR